MPPARLRDPPQLCFLSLLGVAGSTDRSLTTLGPTVEHPERAEGVPATGRFDAVLEIDVDAARMDAVERPPAVGLPRGRAGGRERGEVG